MRDVFFTLLGIVLTASLSYFSGLDLGRLKTSREVQSTAYIGFMKAQIKWDLPEGANEYALGTAEARKEIAIYGSRAVVEALAQYWRQYYDRPACEGSREKQKADAKIYQQMRNDTVWWFERVNDDDMMMLMFLCKSAL